ncbi:MAG: glycosyltransferase [Candidatus Adiutrix sp.]|jgi:tetratricopeptide (TPR) repeat protein|nr:glycosyltransferase [Candidatus Adiutrix sp.]
MASLENTASLGLAMIMKNEALNLPKSLAPVAGLFDEIVAVDTGSSDQSRETARALGARVLDFEWVHDFSAARNFGLQAATTDFIMWLDADNSISPAGLSELRSHLRKKAEIVILATEVVIPQGDRLWQKRVFPNHPEARFEGRVHEQLVHPAHWATVPAEAEILHWGYADPAAARKKGERNLELLLNCGQTSAGEFYCLYQTGRTLFNLRRYEEARLWLTRAVAAETDNRPLMGHAFILLSQTQGRLGLHDEAEKTIRRLVALAPGYGPGHYQLGRLLYDAGKHAEAGEYLETALILGPGDQIWGASQKMCGFRAAFLLGRIWAGQGRLQPARQAFGLARAIDPQNPEPDFALAEAALAEGDAAEARARLERVLELAPGRRRAAELYRRLSQ